MRHVHRVLVVVLLSGLGCSAAPDPIGVAVCDRYVARLDRCAVTLGGRGGDSLRRFGKRLADSWRARAAEADQRDVLTRTCTQAIADARRQHPQCDWPR